MAVRPIALCRSTVDGRRSRFNNYLILFFCNTMMVHGCKQTRFHLAARSINCDRQFPPANITRIRPIIDLTRLTLRYATGANTSYTFSTG